MVGKNSRTVCSRSVRQLFTYLHLAADRQLTEFLISK